MTLKGSVAKQLGIGISYDDWNPVSTQSANGSASGAQSKKPCVLLNFDGDNSGTTTAIVKVQEENAAEGEDTSDRWFNLQGQRINRPTTEGIYIHNGKKVIVNHLTL